MKRALQDSLQFEQDKHELNELNEIREDHSSIVPIPRSFTSKVYGNRSSEETEDSFKKEQNEVIHEHPLVIPINGEILLHETLLENSLPISTGLKKLDILIGGGLYPGELVEIYGKSGTGKSILCHKILAEILTGKLNFTGIYIDSHQNFSIKKFVQFSPKTIQNRNRSSKLSIPTPNNFDRIKILKCFGLDDLQKSIQYNIVSNLENLSSKFYENLRLVLIDAVPFHLYPILDWDSSDSIQKQDDFVKFLKSIAIKHHLTFILVNHGVTMNPTGSTTLSNRSNITASNLSHFGSEPSKLVPPYTIKPALGKFWGSVPNTRLLLTSENEFDVIPGESFSTNSFRAILTKSSRASTLRYIKFNIAEDDVY